MYALVYIAPLRSSSEGQTKAHKQQCWCKCRGRYGTHTHTPRANTVRGVLTTKTPFATPQTKRNPKQIIHVIHTQTHCCDPIIY